MITPLLLQNRYLYILLVLVLLSSCHSSRQVACPEIDTDHPRTRKYKRNYSLAWNRTRKIPKNSVLIKPIEEGRFKDDPEEDMTLLERRTGEQIEAEIPDFADLDNSRSPQVNTLLASKDENYTGPSEIIVSDGPVTLVDSYDQPSKKEVRKIKRDIRRDMRESFKSADSERSPSSQRGVARQDDTIMLFAVTSFVLGIIGIFTMPLLLGLLATIFGAVALGMIRREGAYYGRGLALAGLILGIVLMVVGLILLPFAILGIFI